MSETRTNTRKVVRFWTITAAVVGLVILAGPAAAEPTAFRFSPGGLSQVVFTSVAELESIAGSSNSVTGEISVDLESPGATTGSVSIDAQSFTTGIADRDEHLRSENWIDATTYPEIRFEITGLTVPEGGVLLPATSLTADVSGNLTFHGVTHPLTAQATATYYALAGDPSAAEVGILGNALRIEGSFTFLLSDYGITIPPVLDMKMDDEIHFEFHLTGVDAWAE